MYLYLNIKKGSWTHPTPLGIVRRRPPQFQIYYEKFEGETPHLLMAPGLSTSPNHNIIFSLMFISSIVQNHKVNGDLSANNNMTFKLLRQLFILPHHFVFYPILHLWGQKSIIRQAKYTFQNYTIILLSPKDLSNSQDIP